MITHCKGKCNKRGTHGQRCLSGDGCGNLNAMRLDAGQADAGGRLDRFVSQRVEGASRSLVLEWIRAGRVRVDGSVEGKASRRLRGGEKIDVDPARRSPLQALPEDIDIDILYEDDHIAVVNKPAGMIVHAGAGSRSGTLVNALLHHMDRLSGKPGDSRPGIVHRLDRFTTGAIVVAKRNGAHRLLQEQFQKREVRKLYWAVVEGAFPHDPHGNPRLLRHGRPVMREGRWWLRVELPVRRDKRNRIKMAVAPNGREAVSDVRLLRAGQRYSAVAVRIHTGRTHQVRLHLSSAGHPVVGDTLYGARRAVPEARGLERYLLHARRLEFNHPATGERVRFDAPPDGEFVKLASQLGL